MSTTNRFPTTTTISYYPDDSLGPRGASAEVELDASSTDDSCDNEHHYLPWYTELFHQENSSCAPQLMCATITVEKEPFISVPDSEAGDEFTLHREKLDPFIAPYILQERLKESECNSAEALSWVVLQAFDGPSGVMSSLVGGLWGLKLLSTNQNTPKEAVEIATIRIDEHEQEHSISRNNPGCDDQVPPSTTSRRSTSATAGTNSQTNSQFFTAFKIVGFPRNTIEAVPHDFWQTARGIPWCTDTPGMAIDDFWTVLYHLSSENWENTKCMLLWPSEVLSSMNDSLQSEDALQQCIRQPGRRPPNAQWGYLPLVYRDPVEGKYHVITLYFQLPRLPPNGVGCEFGADQKLRIRVHDANMTDLSRSRVFAWLNSIFESSLRGGSVEFESQVICTSDAFGRTFQNGKRGAKDMCATFSINIYFTLSAYGRPLAMTQYSYHQLYRLLYLKEMQGCSLVDLSRFLKALQEEVVILPGNMGDECIEKKREELLGFFIEMVQESGSSHHHLAQLRDKKMIRMGNSDGNVITPTRSEPWLAKKCPYCFALLPKFCEEVHVATHHKREQEVLIHRLGLLPNSFHWTQCEGCLFPLEKKALAEHRCHCSGTIRSEVFYPKAISGALEQLDHRRKGSLGKPTNKTLWPKRCFFCWSDVIASDESSLKQHMAEHHLEAKTVLFHSLNALKRTYEASGHNPAVLQEFKELDLVEVEPSDLPSYPTIISKYFTADPGCDELIAFLGAESEKPVYTAVFDYLAVRTTYSRDEAEVVYEVQGKVVQFCAADEPLDHTLCRRLLSEPDIKPHTFVAGLGVHQTTAEFCNLFMTQSAPALSSPAASFLMKIQAANLDVSHSARTESSSISVTSPIKDLKEVAFSNTNSANTSFNFSNAGKPTFVIDASRVMCGVSDSTGESGVSVPPLYSATSRGSYVCASQALTDCSTLDGWVIFVAGDPEMNWEREQLAAVLRNWCFVRDDGNGGTVFSVQFDPLAANGKRVEVSSIRFLSISGVKDHNFQRMCNGVILVFDGSEESYQRASRCQSAMMDRFEGIHRPPVILTRAFSSSNSSNVHVQRRAPVECNSNTGIWAECDVDLDTTESRKILDVTLAHVLKTSAMPMTILERQSNKVSEDPRHSSSYIRVEPEPEE